MALILFLGPYFERAFKKLGYEQRVIAGQIIEAVKVYYETDCNLEVTRKVAPRFFYKQLRKPYYEAGIESNIRVVIRRDDEECIALLAGNHDQVRQFLKSF
ncbi:MAG: hypothetical protein HZC17_06590 [Candidatus Omnitrophica bacterium]|nr:hypothetical protein [Candidatus Omnitrophota bacterium]